MRTLFCVILAMTLTNVSLFAYSKSGYKAFTKSCSECHGRPFKGAKMLYSYEWKEIFANNDKKLTELHKEVPEAQESITSSYYLKKRKKLIDFVIDYAADSGKAATCDGNSCGD